jgi:hypothetical protein
MTEKRRAPRQRTFKGATISLPIGSVPCTVRNLSASGALLELQDSTPVPDDFELIIKPEYKRRACHVVRREGRRLGVVFVSGL